MTLCEQKEKQCINFRIDKDKKGKKLNEIFLR